MGSLSLDKSLLASDINDITRMPEGKYSPTFAFTTKLHTENKDLGPEDGLILNSIYIVRDYVKNISDYIEVQLTVGLGTYIYDIYKFLDNIEVSITTFKQHGKGKKPFNRTERYKAAYLAQKNKSIPTTVNQSKEDLNQNLPIVLTLQLLDRSVETLRIKTTQGSFDSILNPKNKDMSIRPFLKSIISEEANKILIENNPPLDNISIEDPDNEDPLKAVMLPSGTHIIDIPDYIQRKNIGIYNSGLGCYIQTFGTDLHSYSKTFFVYSLYNPQKYDKSEYKTIFYSPVSSSVAITDVTYKYKDKVLKVVTHTLSKIHDSKETNVMSTGSGFRVANANSFMKKPTVMTPEGPKFLREGVSTEIVYKERKDNLNYAPNKSITSNQFTLTSEILEKKGNYIVLEISNMDHDFIYPGCPCKINYENNENKVTELYGVIHKAIISYSTGNSNMTMNYNSPVVALTSHITLQVFVVNE